MSDSPSLVAPLVLRCCHANELSGVPDCGDTASWSRRDRSGAPGGFYCHRHRRAGDLPLEGVQRVLRVRVSLFVDLAGVASSRSQSHTEAVDRLVRACQAAGGQANVLNVTSALVENPASLPPGGKTSPRGVGRVGGVKD